MMDITPSSEQRAIINHPAEPVRIAAGAGTGKTTTIVERLAASIAEGADPARALGITFTNKAANELRHRLRATVPERTDGREVEVATYHGFAASIIDEFGSRIGFSSGAQLMDEAHRSELAIRVLRTYEGDLLDLTALPQRRDELLMLASNMRDNLATAQNVRDNAPGNPDETWSKRLVLVDAVEEFESAKEELGFLEYGDLLRLAVRIVEDHPEVASEIRDRYDTVLLDEYQDTDPVQRRLLVTVFAAGTSVTAVGDTDQTIYEWRGASVDNFEEFPNDFVVADGGAADTLPLSINRRSDRQIIAIANAVKSKLPDVAGAAPLVAQESANEGSVAAAWHATEADEASWIAQDVLDRHASGTPYREIAVLCRKRDSMRPIAEAFRQAGVPYSVGSMGELLNVPEITDLMAWLTVLADPSDEASLLRVLTGGRYRLGMSEIAALTRSRPARSATLIDAVLVEDLPAALDGEAVDAIRAFGSVFEDLFVQSQAMSVPGILEAVLSRLDYWSEVAVLPAARATTTRINITRFTDLTERWRPLDGTPSLSGYLRYLSALDESGRAEELDAAELPVDDAVRILTAHGAKGLEWDEVYLPALSDKIFPSSVNRYYDPIDSHVALPYALQLDAGRMAEVDQTQDIKERRRLLKVRHDDQEWRLAYVAVTRARHRLVFSGHAWHGDNKRPKTMSDLLVLAMDHDGVVLGPVVEDPGDRPDAPVYHAPPPPPDPLFDRGWGDALRNTVRDASWVEEGFPDVADAAKDKQEQLGITFADLHEPTVGEAGPPFATSVTNLVALAECPLKFRWIHHDRLPRKPRISAVKGTEFHRRAELHNLGVIALDDQDTVTYDEPATDTVGDTAAARAGVDPWDVFAASRFHEVRPTYVETPFEISIDGRRLRGKVDAVYATDDHWEIVDYKSGAPSRSASKAVQLQAYAVAAQEGAISLTAPGSIDVSFAYFGVDPAVVETEHADTAWMGTATARIGNLLEQAETGPFPATPTPACRWCDFLHHCSAGKAAVASDD